MLVVPTKIVVERGRDERLAAIRYDTAPLPGAEPVAEAQSERDFATHSSVAVIAITPLEPNAGTSIELGDAMKSDERVVMETTSVYAELPALLKARNLKKYFVAGVSPETK